jgi:AraC-like DNA-binding protein
MDYYQNQQTTISSWALAVVKTLASYGHNPDEALEKSGIDKKLLDDPDARISAESMSRLWYIVLQTAHDPCFGLKAAGNIRPTTLHALGFALMVSSHMEDALERFYRFYRVVSDVIEVKFEYLKDVAAISLNPRSRPARLPDEAFDMIVAVFVSFARMVIDAAVNPLKVELIRKAPDRPEAFQDFFRAPVIFSGEQNRVFFSLRDMKKPFQAANAEIARRNEQIVVEYLARFDKSRITHRVHEKLIELLPLGEPSIQSLADAIGMTTRSLHRHLQKENAGYREILNDIRQYLAIQYLKQPHVPIIEVAFRLGYSDSGNFTRAFKRWFHLSPKQYRHTVAKRSF